MARYFSNKAFSFVFFQLFPLPCKATVGNCRATCITHSRDRFALPHTWLHRGWGARALKGFDLGD